MTGQFREEFHAHGLSGTIRLRHRNVCKDGFGEEPSDIDAGMCRSCLVIAVFNAAFAVFLDLPAPWEAIPHVTKVLRVS